MTSLWGLYTWSEKLYIFLHTLPVPIFRVTLKRKGELGRYVDLAMEVSGGRGGLPVTCAETLEQIPDTTRCHK